MAQTLSSIANRQSKVTEQTKAETNHFLDYCRTHPDARVRFIASDMILTLHSDGSYNSEPGSKSRAAGHWYLSNKGNHNLSNGAIMTLSKIINFLMSSAGETEAATAYLNCKAALPLRIALEEMGHPQPPTPLCTDNNTANGIINGIFKQDRSKAIDMRFYWLVDRVQQGQFNVCWDSGKKNLADHFTKHHPPTHHKQVRPICAHSKDSPRSFQGCVERLGRLARAGSNCHAPAAPAA